MKKNKFAFFKQFKQFPNLFDKQEEYMGGLTQEVIDILIKNYSDLIKELKELGIKKNQLGKLTIDNLIGQIKLDNYINATKDNFTSPLQKPKTCYANAIAAAIHLSLSRIVSRVVEDFYSIRKKIIKDHGKNGADPNKVLKDYCPKYNLKYKIVDEEEAISAARKKRPQVFFFALDDEQWKAFSAFYEKSPCGILKKEDLNVHKDDLNILEKYFIKLVDIFCSDPNLPNEENKCDDINNKTTHIEQIKCDNTNSETLTGIIQSQNSEEEITTAFQSKEGDSAKGTPPETIKKRVFSGHAVVLWKVEKDHLVFMNSWGENFADKGFFRVENAMTLGTYHKTYFYDVYWTQDMLTTDEISKYDIAVLDKFRDLERRIYEI